MSQKLSATSHRSSPPSIYCVFWIIIHNVRRKEFDAEQIIDSHAFKTVPAICDNQFELAKPPFHLSTAWGNTHEQVEECQDVGRVTPTLLVDGQPGLQFWHLLAVPQNFAAVPVDIGS